MAMSLTERALAAIRRQATTRPTIEHGASGIDYADIGVCTGHWERLRGEWGIFHDGDTCPIHEMGDDDAD